MSIGMFNHARELPLSAGVCGRPALRVIRDLRDTLTAQYFGLKGTPPSTKLGRVTSGAISWQEDKDDGLVFLCERDLTAHQIRVVA